MRNLTKEEKEKLQRSAPSVVGTLIFSSVVLQRRIAELNLKLSPPDVLIRPKLAGNPPRYHRAKHGIEAGEVAAREAIAEIKRLIGSRE